MTFFEEFKAMFDNPLERGKLIEFFDQCVAEATQSPKPTLRIAIFGHYNDFLRLAYLEGTQAEIEGNVIKVGKHLTLEHCVNDIAVYGQSFNGFCVYTPPEMQLTNAMYDAAAFLAGHNVPKISKDALHSMVRDYSL